MQATTVKLVKVSTTNWKEQEHNISVTMEINDKEGKITFSDARFEPEVNDPSGYPIVIDSTSFKEFFPHLPQGAIGTIDCYAYQPHDNASSDCYRTMKGELSLYGDYMSVHVKDNTYPKVKAFFACQDSNVDKQNVGIKFCSCTFTIPDTDPEIQTNPYLVNLNGTMTDVQFLQDAIEVGSKE